LRCVLNKHNGDAGVRLLLLERGPPCPTARGAHRRLLGSGLGAPHDGAPGRPARSRNSAGAGCCRAGSAPHWSRSASRCCSPGSRRRIW